MVAGGGGLVDEGTTANAVIDTQSVSLTPLAALRIPPGGETRHRGACPYMVLHTGGAPAAGEPVGATDEETGPADVVRPTVEDEDEMRAHSSPTRRGVETLGRIPWPPLRASSPIIPTVQGAVSIHPLPLGVLTRRETCLPAVAGPSRPTTDSP